MEQLRGLKEQRQVAEYKRQLLLRDQKLWQLRLAAISQKLANQGQEWVVAKTQQLANQEQAAVLTRCQLANQERPSVLTIRQLANQEQPLLNLRTGLLAANPEKESNLKNLVPTKQRQTAEQNDFQPAVQKQAFELNNEQLSHTLAVIKQEPDHSCESLSNSSKMFDSIQLPFCDSLQDVAQSQHELKVKDYRPAHHWAHNKQLLLVNKSCRQLVEMKDK